MVNSLASIFDSNNLHSIHHDHLGYDMSQELAPTDSLPGDFDSLGENLSKFWDKIAQERRTLSLTASTSTTASSTVSSAPTSSSQHQQVASALPLTSSTSSTSTTASSNAPTIPVSHTQQQQPSRVETAVAAIVIASIADIVTPSFNGQRQSQFTNKRKYPGASNGSEEQSNKRHQTSPQSCSQANSSSSADFVNINIHTTTSSSSSAVTNIFLHFTREQNQPNENDFVAAGVHENGSYDDSMLNDDDAEIWKNIKNANVKWHNNIAHAWVRYVNIRRQLLLAFLPIPDIKLHSLEVSVSAVTPIKKRKVSPYEFIHLTPTTSSTSSTSTSTSSQACPSTNRLA